MKRAWDPVKLRVDWGDVPEPGDILQMATGRRYLVFKVGGLRTLHCLVLPPEEPNGDRKIWDWEWSPRKRRSRLPALG